jgi:hypothetical protein
MMPFLLFFQEGVAIITEQYLYLLRSLQHFDAFHGGRRLST